MGLLTFSHICPSNFCGQKIVVAKVDIKNLQKIPSTGYFLFFFELLNRIQKPAKISDLE